MFSMHGRLSGWLCFCLLFALPFAGQAQQTRSAADSLRTANQQRLDSIRTAREAALAELKAAQKVRADSLAALRKYRESKRYKDSLAAARQSRTDSIRQIQQQRLDSIGQVRQQTRDSITAAIAERKATTDSLRAIQKVRTDSLAALRKYRESKRYADSVAVVRKARTDSIQLARKAFADSAAASRKAIAETLTAARKKTADSLAAIRKVTTDSLTASRKKRADSIAAVRKTKEQASKDRMADKVKKQELAFNLKISKKREKWSNESMLKKKWSLPRRQLQNLFTRDNYWFNANRKMEEAEANMLRAKQDSYDSLISLFPFNPDTDSSLLSADMDSIVQKASVGIQIHDPRTDWADDLYLLMGQAYYYRGRYDEAATAFRYIVSLRELRKKEEEKKRRNADKPVARRREVPSIVEAEDKSALDFLKRESAHNDALLWLARTYTQSGRYGEAESILDLLVNDPAFPESLRSRYSLEMAYLALKTRNYKNATTPLLAVVEDKSQPTWLRQRAGFLGGQLLYREGKYREAAGLFARTESLHPALEMDFQARKYQAYSVMAAGDNSAETIASLQKLLKDTKYAPYHEQVYYVLGKLASGEGNRTLATTYLRKGIEAPRATRSQKALSYLALADVYYADAAYPLAQAAYDSAAYLAGRAQSGKPPFDVAVRRSKSLTAVAGPAREMARQDSLLALAALPEKEQRAAIRKHLKNLEKQRRDAQDQEAGPGPSLVTDVSSLNADNNWYFNSATTLQQGALEFKRKWGNRANTDNWRRASASRTAIAGNNALPAGGSVNPGTPEGNALLNGRDPNGMPTEEALYAAIPHSEQEMEQMKKQLQRSYIDLAGAYTNELEDYSRAVKTLDDLDRRFPGHNQQAEALYLGYLVYLRQNQIERAQMLSQQLLEKYPNTDFAKRVKPADDLAGPLMTSTISAAEYYEKTYDLVQNRAFAEALARSRDGQKRWNEPRISERFRILEIMSLTGTGDYNGADTLAAVFIGKTSSDSLRSWAETLRGFIKSNRPAPLDSARAATASTAPLPAGTPVSGSNPAPGLPPTASGSNVVSLPPPATYAYQPTAPHYFVVHVPAMEPRAMGLRAGLGDMSQMRFATDSLQTDFQLMATGQGLVAVKGFANATKARTFAQTFRNTPVLMREYQSTEVKTFVISDANFRKLLADADVNAYLQFYRSKYRP